MPETIVAFLPCRRGSERVKNKNTRPFADRPNGLIEIKMEQLLRCKAIDEIVVSTDDPVVMERCQDSAKGKPTPVRIVKRPPDLALSSTSTDELILHVPSLILEGVVLWTHVTSPFVDEKIYAEAVHAYRRGLLDGTHDSLVTVTRVQTYLWNDEGPVNYDRTAEKWPRTQTLPLWYEINSAIFLADVAVYREQEDRLGRSPRLFALDGDVAMDIDREDDFALAQARWLHRG
jgi:CMP-N-acetylneuraminic acid synthetase